MKISTKVECGIVALVDICVNSDSGETVTVVNISKRQNISAKYLEQILPLLRHASIIRSVKGAKGGYMLSRSAADITLREIITALDSTVLSDVSFEGRNDSVINSAISDCLWTPMTSFLQSFADKVTLNDIAKKYGEITEENAEEPMYYI